MLACRQGFGVSLSLIGVKRKDGSPRFNRETTLVEMLAPVVNGQMSSAELCRDCLAWVSTSVLYAGKLRT